MWPPSPSCSPGALILLGPACLEAMECLLPTKVGKLMAAPGQLNMQISFRSDLPQPLCTGTHHRNMSKSLFHERGNKISWQSNFFTSICYLQRLQGLSESCALVFFLSLDFFTHTECLTHHSSYSAPLQHPGYGSYPKGLPQELPWLSGDIFHFHRSWWNSWQNAKCSVKEEAS